MGNFVSEGFKLGLKVVKAKPIKSGIGATVLGVGVGNNLLKDDEVKLATPEPQAAQNPVPVNLIQADGLVARPSNKLPSLPAATARTTTTTTSRKILNDVQVAVPEPVIPDSFVQREDGSDISRKGIWRKFGVQALTGDEARAAGLIPKDSESELFLTNEGIDVAGFDFSRRAAALLKNKHTPTGQLKDAQQRVLDSDAELRTFTERKVNEFLLNQPQYAVAKQLLPQVLGLARQGDEQAGEQVVKLQGVISAAENHAATMAQRALATNVPLNRQASQAALDMEAAKKTLLENTQSVVTTATNGVKTNSDLAKVLSDPIVRLYSFATGLDRVKAAQALKFADKDKGLTEMLLSVNNNNGSLSLNSPFERAELSMLNANIARAEDVRSDKEVVDSLLLSYKSAIQGLYSQATETVNAAEVAREEASKFDVTDKKRFLKAPAAQVFNKPTKEALKAKTGEEFRKLAHRELKVIGLTRAIRTDDPVINALASGNATYVELTELMKGRKGKPDEAVTFGTVLHEYRANTLANFNQSQVIYNKFFTSESEVNAQVNAISQKFWDLQRDHLQLGGTL